MVHVGYPCIFYPFCCNLIDVSNKTYLGPGWPTRPCPTAFECMCSVDTRFSRNVFEVFHKAHSTCFIRSKTTRLRLVVLNPDKTLLLVFLKTLHNNSVTVLFIYILSTIMRLVRRLGLSTIAELIMFILSTHFQYS